MLSSSLLRSATVTRMAPICLLESIKVEIVLNTIHSICYFSSAQDYPLVYGISVLEKE